MLVAMTVPRRSLLFGLVVALGACGRSGLDDADATHASDASVPPYDAANTPVTEDAGGPAEASLIPPSTEDADSPRV